MQEKRLGPGSKEWNKKLDEEQQKAVDEIVATAKEKVDSLNIPIPDFDIKQTGTAAHAEDIPHLFCFGCSHCDGVAKFPGRPSGERPCFFCVRNPEREKWQSDFKHSHGKMLLEWYDGTPICFYPMDAYQPIDMIEQQERWEKKAKGDPNWNEPEGGLRFG